MRASAVGCSTASKKKMMSQLGASHSRGSPPVMQKSQTATRAQPFRSRANLATAFHCVPPAGHRSTHRTAAAHVVHRMVTPLAVAALISACGGGGNEAADDTDSAMPAGGDRVHALATSATSPNCLRVPAAPTPPGQRQVSDFGALPDDNRDDTAAIQRALDSLRAGQTLVFSPGRYQISHSLHVRNPGITITGPNATIHATNPDDQALVIEADNTTVASLTFTAVTDVRRSAAWHSRIVIADDIGGGNYRTVFNTVI